MFTYETKERNPITSPISVKDRRENEKMRTIIEKMPVTTTT